MSLTCMRMESLAAAALGGHATEAERIELEMHLQGCRRCSERHARLSLVRRMKGWEPPPLSDVARERVRRAVLASAGASAKASPARSPLARFAAVAGVVAVAVVGLAWGLRPPSARVLDGDVRVFLAREARDPAEGIGSVAPPGRAIAAAARLLTSRGGRVLLDGPIVELRQDTEVLWDARRRVVVLMRGAVVADVTPGGGTRFRVATPRFIVEVLGTRFTVDPGGVSTERGVVRVLSPTGEQLAVVAAGESWRLPAPPVAAAQLPAAATVAASPPPAASPLPASVASPVSAPRPAPRAVAHPSRSAAARADVPRAAAATPDPLAAVRQALSRGNGRHARALLAPLLDGPAAAPPAEAGLLEAESYLVEGRYDAAVARYRRVARDWDGTPEGESALYAIAQLALERSDAAGAAAALEQYLRRYPSGRFAAEARERRERIRAAGGAP